MTYLPSMATGHEKWGGLVTASPFSAYVFDRTIKFLWNLPNISDATPANLKSHGAGTIALAEINSSETCGFTADSDNDSYSWRLYLPLDIDLEKTVDFSVEWSCSSAASAGSCLWVIKNTPLTSGTTAVAVGATALGTAIANDTCVGANIPTWTEWGTLAASTWAAYVPGDDSVVQKLYADVTTITDATAYQVRMRYYRRFVA